MEIQSWMIRSWPSVEWYPPALPDDWPVFSHVGTRVYDHTDAAGRCFGNTVWIGNINGHTTGAAWEWTEFRSGVVVLTDPNTIVSNIQFKAEGGGFSDAVNLNRIAYSLPWQEAVCRVIRAIREYPVVSPATAGRPLPAKGHRTAHRAPLHAARA